jgi:uncharacterized protein YbgA (DUF1722 family)/uncharacterized protein YbbK (DUF523 family)
MTKNIVIGISACLMGENVRYDGSGKKSKFCVEELGQHVSFKAFCPEVAVGLPVPRPTIRQIKKQDLIHVARPDGSGDVTEALQAYGKKVALLAKDFSGYVFCAKSPTCGMERVKVYNEKGAALAADGIGVFANEIMKANPLLPCEENGRLNDAILRENFVARVFVYHHWQQLVATGLSKHKLMTFHSHYKYMLMSHDVVAYRSLGRLIGSGELAIDEMAHDYISGLMTALKITATRKKHANTLQHIQGYFSKHLNALERQELCRQIDDYRKGLVPLVVPLTLIKHYLLHYPKKYLAQQAYLNPYPEQLRLRYGY